MSVDRYSLCLKSYRNEAAGTTITSPVYPAIMPDKDGPFIRFDDYQRLESRVRELEAERDRLNKALTNVQDERASSFAMLQKAVGEPYGLTPYQPEFDLEIAANIQRLRARHAKLILTFERLSNQWQEESEFLTNNSVGSDIAIGNTYLECSRELKAALAGEEK